MLNDECRMKNAERELISVFGLILLQTAFFKINRIFAALNQKIQT